MKHLLYLLVLLPLLLQGCGALPAPGTATPVPTDTSVPTSTSTPLPTETPTPLPTSTPDKTATAAVKTIAVADAILNELDKTLGDTDIPYKEGHLQWQQVKPLMVTLQGPGWDYVEVDDDLVGKNFILKSDVTWEASGIIICGMIFRSEPNVEQGKQYQFLDLRLSGLPAWEIDVFEYGRFQNSPTGAQYSDAIDQANRATNTILLVAQDEQFTVYINDVRHGRYFDYSKQRTEGVFAFRAWQDSGQGTCNFENSWVWALDD